MYVTRPLWNAAGARKRDGLKSSQTIATARAPQSAAIRMWAESAAGIDDAPGSVKPSASTIDVIVEAVPMALQMPNERVIRLSRSIQSSAPIAPARSSSQ